MNINTIRFASSILFMPTDITVLLPETPPEKNERLRVLWLLHGANGDDRNFLYSTPLKEYLKRHRCAVVMPSALNSDYGKYDDFGTGYDFPSFFFSELMPFIQGTFPVSAKREDNFLAGVSMGGYGAMSLGLMRPERFAAIGMMGASLRESAFLAPYENEKSEVFKAAAMADPRSFPTEYGPPQAGIKRKEINVICKYPTIREFLDSPDCMWRRFPEAVQAGLLPYIYTACGTNDLFYEPVLHFKDLAEKCGVSDKVRFVIAEGIGHDVRFFDEQIGCFMDFYNI